MPFFSSDSSVPLASPPSSVSNEHCCGGEEGDGNGRGGLTTKARVASFKLRKLSKAASYSSPTERLPLKNKVKMLKKKKQEAEQAAAEAAAGQHKITIGPLLDQPDREEGTKV